MSDIAIFNPANAPAFARKSEMSDIAKALTGVGGSSSGQRVSIKGGVLRLIADGKEIATVDERFLDLVIVKAAPKIALFFSPPSMTKMRQALPPTASPTMATSQTQRARRCSLLHARAVQTTSPVLVRATPAPASISSAWLW